MTMFPGSDSYIARVYKALRAGNITPSVSATVTDTGTTQHNSVTQVQHRCYELARLQRVI